MKSKIKPYQIDIIKYDNDGGFGKLYAIGHFFKDGFFVVEKSNGDRDMINNDDIKEIIIDKAWLDEGEDEG